MPGRDARPDGVADAFVPEDWRPGMALLVGDLVTYEGKIYRKVGVPSSPEVFPGAGFALVGDSPPKPPAPTASPTFTSADGNFTGPEAPTASCEICAGHIYSNGFGEHREPLCGAVRALRVRIAKLEQLGGRVTALENPPPLLPIDASSLLVRLEALKRGGEDADYEHDHAVEDCIQIVASMADPRSARRSR